MGPWFPLGSSSRRRDTPTLPSLLLRLHFYTPEFYSKYRNTSVKQIKRPKEIEETEIKQNKNKNNK